MGSSANITSVAEIGHFRLALKSFEQGASDAMLSAMMQIRRVVEWVEHDQLQYWQMRVKRGFDEVSETRTTLERCQMFALEGERRSCDEEKKAFEKAKRNLRHAEEKVQVVKKWARSLSHETAEYQAAVSSLGGWLESECPKALASLERMMKSLEAYLATDVADTSEPTSVVTSQPTSAGTSQPTSAMARSEESDPEESDSAETEANAETDPEKTNPAGDSQEEKEEEEETPCE